jgi:catechol 2,3-dioxygenase-like lactoylglutathione lyase family enzyme
MRLSLQWDWAAALGCPILSGATAQGKPGGARMRAGQSEPAFRAAREASSGVVMPRVVGIDHLVLSVGDFARSQEFYQKLLGFLGFKLKYEFADMAGWSNGKTLFWIAAADAQGRKRNYRKGDIGFHHYAFELSSRKDVDELGAFLQKHGMTVVDPAGEYYGRNYYAVYFADPDGMKLEGMIWAPPRKKKAPARKKARKKRS